MSTGSFTLRYKSEQTQSLTFRHYIHFPKSSQDKLLKTKSDHRITLLKKTSVASHYTPNKIHMANPPARPPAFSLLALLPQVSTQPLWYSCRFSWAPGSFLPQSLTTENWASDPGWESESPDFSWNNTFSTKSQAPQVIMFPFPPTSIQPRALGRKGLWREVGPRLCLRRNLTPPGLPLAHGYLPPPFICSF